MEKCIAVIDMKAFYAFVECVERNVNPFTTPLVVCDTTRGEGTIVLSVSPYLKEMGVPSRCRKRELPKMDNMIFATPQMEKYVKKSAEVVSIVLSFVGEDDIHVYSIDELFVNLGPYLKMYNCTPKQLVLKMQKAIYKQTKLISTAGIGENMLMAKLALDLDGKKTPPYIAQWTKEDIKTKLWPISPLSKMWGISRGYEKKLNSYGIYTIGQLANTPKEFLKEKLGVMGEQLHEHANGIDNTNIRDKYIPEENSFSLGQVLHEDYKPTDAKLLIREMNDDLSSRLRSHGEKTQVVSLYIQFDYETGGGFAHQAKLDFPTDDTELLLDDLYRIFDKYIDGHLTRGIHICYGSLVKNNYDQLSLFEDEKTQADRKALQHVLDEVHNKYGQNSLLRGSSLLEKSTAKERHNQIGGHKR
ncbi:MAG: damage repair protein [Bacilli bacterium]|nr:damage repair protein [Bacilli bacterium]